jgi:hypothetical protein
MASPSPNTALDLAIGKVLSSLRVIQSMAGDDKGITERIARVVTTSVEVAEAKALTVMADHFSNGLMIGMSRLEGTGGVESIMTSPIFARVVQRAPGAPTKPRSREVRKALTELPMTFNAFKKYSSQKFDMKPEDFKVPETLYDARSYGAYDQEEGAWARFKKEGRAKLSKMGVVFEKSKFEMNIRAVEQYVTIARIAEKWTKYHMTTEMLMGVKTFPPKAPTASVVLVEENGSKTPCLSRNAMLSLENLESVESSPKRRKVSSSSSSSSSSDEEAGASRSATGKAQDKEESSSSSSSDDEK